MQTLAMGQVDNPPKKQEIKVGNLDVIYDDEEYKGVVDEPEEEPEDDNLMYQVPYFREMGNEEDDLEEEQRETFTLTDDGAESEDEILLEGFDTAVIHLPRLDVRTRQIHMAYTVDLASDEPFRSTPPPLPLWTRPSSAYGRTHLCGLRRCGEGVAQEQELWPPGDNTSC